MASRLKTLWQNYKYSIAASAIIGTTFGGHVMDTVDKHNYRQNVINDTAKVSAALEALLDVPATLIKFDCNGDANCDRAGLAAQANAGLSPLNGYYLSMNYDQDLNKAFATCARNHGWSNCRANSVGAEILAQPYLLVPKDKSKLSLSQMVWLRAGHELNTVLIGTDAKPHYFPLQLRAQIN